MPVSAPVIVTVTYDTDPTTNQPVVTVKPRVATVRPGQMIRFVRTGPLHGTMRITFADRAFFDGGNPRFADTGAIHEGDADVHVKSIPRRTTYVCELLDANGTLIARSPKDAGGAVEPEKN